MLFSYSQLILKACCQIMGGTPRSKLMGGSMLYMVITHTIVQFFICLGVLLINTYLIYDTKLPLMKYFLLFLLLFSSSYLQSQTSLPLTEQFDQFDTIGRWTSPGLVNTGSHSGELCYNIEGTYDVNSWLIFESPIYDFTAQPATIELLWFQETSIRSGDLFRLYYFDQGDGLWYYFDLGALTNGLKSATIPNTADRFTFDLITYGNGNVNNKYAHIEYFEIFNSFFLPVELLYFNSKIEKDGTVLEWSTASEINSDYYSLFRSLDAYDWTELIEIKAAGNSNQVLTYQYLDPYVHWGVTYYKLEQTDFDGTISHSWQPVSVLRDAPKPLSIIMRCDIQGREVDKNHKGLVIEYYSDGTSRKLFKQ